MKRVYINYQPDFDDEIYTIQEWKKLANRVFYNSDGSGYWMKDGMKSSDEVFSTPSLDATHVIWYNK
jgi:hypothetical protein